MTQYKVSYACVCEDGRCEVTMTRNEGVVGPPPVCVLGKNVSSILSNGFPKWELKGQRFKPNGNEDG